MSTTLDARDESILAHRQTLLDRIEGPREGDHVLFPNGTERRISFVSPDSWLPEVSAVQTSDSGSWYLGEHGCSFSGSLHPPVKHETLTLTEETRDGAVWFFHHDHARAHNGIRTVASFRVYQCNENAPT